MLSCFLTVHFSDLRGLVVAVIIVQDFRDATFLGQFFKSFLTTRIRQTAQYFVFVIKQYTLLSAEPANAFTNR